jgi:hypothetical protein
MYLSGLDGSGANVKKIAMINFLLSTMAGVLIWALSPIVAGTKEPWDSNGLYYPLALLMAGLILGATRPRLFWIHYPGILFGQCIWGYFFLPSGPLWVFGMGFLVVYSALCFLGAAVGAGMRRLARRSARVT